MTPAEVAKRRRSVGKHGLPGAQRLFTGASLNMMKHGSEVPIHKDRDEGLSALLSLDGGSKPSTARLLLGGCSIPAGHVVIGDTTRLHRVTQERGGEGALRVSVAFYIKRAVVRRAAALAQPRWARHRRVSLKRGGRWRRGTVQDRSPIKGGRSRVQLDSGGHEWLNVDAEAEAGRLRRLQA